MGTRFRKSKQIAPGVRLNVGKKGASVTLGSGAVKQTFSTTGRKTTSVKTPIDGVSYVKTSGGARRRTDSSRRTTTGNRPVSTPPNNRRKKKKKGSCLGSILAVVVVIVVFSMIFGKTPEEQVAINKQKELQKQTEISKEETKAESESTLSEEDEIKQFIEEHILSEYEKTDIDHITINQDLGTDNPDDFIALVYVKWNVKNSESATTEILKMYSDDLAASIANNYGHVQEVAAFWDVPYLSTSGKWSYERNGSDMYLTDAMFANKSIMEKPESEKDPPIQTIRMYTTDSVNIRDAASSDSNVLETVDKYTMVSVLSIDGEWAKIEYNDSEAYVSVQFLSNQAPQLVWIPETGSKYHKRQGCSGMENPTQVTVEEAESMGYEPCKKC